MQHWVINGAGGQLGQCLWARLAERERTLTTTLAREQLDLSQLEAVDDWFDDTELGAVDFFVNAAAYTAVDRAEDEEALALQVNGVAPGRMAARCREAGIRFVHVSTDYVFDGQGTAPYPVDATTGPVTAYGRTKLAGETAVRAADPEALIVRTSWVFGPGKNFVLAILNQARLRRSGEVEGPLTVVDDQRGCPTYADDLAQGLIALADRGATGLLHLANAGSITWWDFARAILDESGYTDLLIEPISTETLSLPASRPAYSVLDCSRAAALGVELRGWRDALISYLRTVDAAAEGAA